MRLNFTRRFGFLISFLLTVIWSYLEKTHLKYVWCQRIFEVYEFTITMRLKSLQQASWIEKTMLNWGLLRVKGS